MNRCFMIATVAICGFANTLMAQVKIEHKPKYEEGQKSKLQVELNLEQKLTLNGMDVDTKVEQFMIVSNSVDKRSDEGNITINSQFEVLQTNLNLPGGLELSFDSGDADKQADNPVLEPIRKLLQASSKAKWQSIIGKDNRIESVSYTNDVFDSIDEALKKEVNPERHKKGGQSGN